MAAIKSLKAAWAKPTLWRMPLTDQIKAEILAQSEKSSAGKQDRDSKA